MLGGNLFEKFGKEFKAGEILFCEFEPGNDFYLIQDGEVRITKIVKDTEKTMDILMPGDIFGEMAILEEAPRSASAIAETDVSVLNFNRENFVTLMTGQPQLAYKLLVIFTKRIFDAKRRLMILLLDDISSKVADVFLMLAEKEVNYESLIQVSLPATIDDIAHWCGESVDEVQPVINHWQKVGKIEVYTDRLEIANINDFKRIVNLKRRSMA